MLLADTSWHIHCRLHYFDATRCVFELSLYLVSPSCLLSNGGITNTTLEDKTQATAGAAAHLLPQAHLTTHVCCNSSASVMHIIIRACNATHVNRPCNPDQWLSVGKCILQKKRAMVGWWQPCLIQEGLLTRGSAVTAARLICNI